MEDFQKFPAEKQQVEHMVPEMIKYIFDNKLGQLNYQCETDPVDYQTLEKVMEIEDKKMLQKSPDKHKSGKQDYIQEQMAEYSDVHQDDDDEEYPLERANTAQTVDIFVEQEPQQNDTFDKQELLCGPKARKQFWNLYKSDRKFKDFDVSNDQTDDPRFAFFQACQEMNMNPRAGLIIKDKESPILDFTNVPLQNKAMVQAISEAIKRYGFNITEIYFINNNLKTQGTVILLESLTRHLNKLKILNISQNVLAKQASESIADLIPEMKVLMELHLCEARIGDKGIARILQTLHNCHTGLEALDLSGNLIGKSAFFGECATELCNYLDNNKLLDKLLLNSNMLRGPHGEKIMRSLLQVTGMSIFCCRNNFLGESHGGRQAPIDIISDLLQQSLQIEHLDISYNFITVKSMFCISNGIKLNKSLKFIEVEGNPLGQIGIRMLIQAINSNDETEIGINKKGIEAETDLLMTNKEDLTVFNPQNPEGPYSLRLDKKADQIILNHLLVISEKYSKESEGAYEQKACFNGVKFNNKPKWDPPTAKFESGIYDLSTMSEGKLEFNFTINPITYKQEMQKLQKKLQEAESEGVSQEKLQKLPKKPEAKQIISQESISKSEMGQQQMNKLINKLLKQHQNGDSDGKKEIVLDVCRKHNFWSSEAFEILHLFKDQIEFVDVASLLMSTVRDPQNKFSLVTHFAKQSQEFLTEIRKKLGDSLLFSFFNPSGHYKLDLANPLERQVAMCLHVLNKQVNDLMCNNQMVDRSPHGNKSAFRNERIDGASFDWWPQWNLPEAGIFECDFVYFLNKPNPVHELSQSEFEQLCGWFQTKYSDIKERKDADEQIGLVFRAVSEYFTFHSQQLATLVTLIPGAQWRLQVYTSGIHRVHDYQNYDIIKHLCNDYPEVMQQLYKRFGILNLFCPFRPTGSYLLNLGIFEERQVCRMMLELAKGEGWANLQNVSLNGKQVAAVNNEFLRQLPTFGTFEGTYMCEEAKQKEEVRENLGRKYLDWD